MSSDLKIEIFAFYIFYEAFEDLGAYDTKKKIREIYRDECRKDNSYLEACAFVFKEGIHNRLFAFTYVYGKELPYDNARSWKSLYDFSDHITLVCDRNDLFGYLTIFERMLASCAYVMHLCSAIKEHCPIDVLTYSHLIWAMYFDKFTEIFYDEGGWNELKRVAKRYGQITDFMIFLRVNRNTISYLHVWKESLLNYIQFKKAAKYISQYKHKRRVFVWKLWVKFHLEHFKDYQRIPFSYEASVDSFEVEMLLEQSILAYESFYHGFGVFQTMLKELQVKYNCNGKVSLETLNNGEATKTKEDLLIKNLKTCETVNNNIPDSKTILEKQLQSECSASGENIAHRIIAETKNVRSNSSERKILSCKSGENLDRYSSNGCCNSSDETRTEKSLIPLNLSYIKNEAECYVNLEVTNALSTVDMSITQCEQNAVPKKFLAANDIAKNSNNRIQTDRELDKLKEQTDPEIKNFLRRILCL